MKPSYFDRSYLVTSATNVLQSGLSNWTLSPTASR
jgi:hypothetical protein